MSITKFWKAELWLIGITLNRIFRPQHTCDFSGFQLVFCFQVSVGKHGIHTEFESFTQLGCDAKIVPFICVVNDINTGASIGIQFINIIGILVIGSTVR